MEKLEPIYDGRKSFYGKAKTYRDSQENLILHSYNTDVAMITPEGNLVLYGFYSATTTRHIREFAKQHIEVKPWTRKELEEALLEA